MGAARGKHPAGIGRRSILWAVVLAAVACWLAPGEALAADFVVTSNVDTDDAIPGNGLCATITPGQCTLRAAIREANALGGGPHNITLPPNVYTLTRVGNDDTAINGDLDITANIVVNGIFAPANFIQACDVAADPDCTGIDRVFDVQQGGSLTLVGVTVRKGNASSFGGGIRSSRTLVLTNVVLDDNRASSQGGGLFVNVVPGGSTLLTNVTVSNNRANGAGGGILVGGGDLTLTNVTIAGNTAERGGGLERSNQQDGTSTTLTNVTIVGNTATQSGMPGGVHANSGAITLRNSIVANNTQDGGGTSNCGTTAIGTFTSQGFNLVFPGTGCGLAAATNDLINVDPKLGPLQANGGQVPTMALLPGSPAIDAGNPAAPGSGGAACVAADARGVARTADGNLFDATGRCDIGAYELASFLVTSTADADDATPGNLSCATSTPGQCTLRAAIREANALGGAAIGVSPGSYTLTRTGADDTAQNGDLDIVGHVLIVGTSATNTFIQACDVGANPNCTGIDRVFDVLPGGGLTMQFLTVRKGFAGAGSFGAGILNRGTLSLTAVSLDGNTGGNGAGLRNLGGPATATLTRVSIVNNRTDNGNGGGILSLDAGLSLTNVTLSGNTAVQGGGLNFGGSASPSATLTNVTIANNANTGSLPGAGIHVGASSVTLRNSIVANNTSGSGNPNNCSSSGTFTSQGFNLVFPGTGCGLAAGTNDLLNADPKLGPLQNNGGPTPTRALLAGSAAIDAGNPAAPGSGGSACATTDQRTTGRPQDGDGVGGARCDIGAYEARLAEVCLQRPPVQLAVTRNGQGGLNVTVTRGLGTLTELRLHGDPSAHVSAPNALVDVLFFTGASGEIVIFPAAGSTTQQFTVRPANPTMPTTLPIDVFDACGLWRTLVGGGAGSMGSGGTFTLSGLGPSLAPGQTTTAMLDWALPAPRRWRDLAAVELRLRDADGVAWGVRWTETGDAFVVTETRTPPLFTLSGPRTHGSGPTGQSVMLTLPVQALPAAAGRTFALEVRASDDAGVVHGFESAGSLTVPATGSAPPTVQESGVQAPIVETRNADKPPKLTEQERWQQARTNAGSREDERIEGDVLAVDCAARPPTVTIGNRDGQVVVELRGEAVGDCERIRPGQYVEADGEKVHEQRFLADRVNAE